MWCATSNGITAYDGASWVRYGTFDGLPSPGGNDFAEDRNNTLWIATDSGVAQFSNGKWIELDLPEEVADIAVYTLAADIVNGAVWMGTEFGLVRYSIESSQ